MSNEIGNGESVRETCRRILKVSTGNADELLRDMESSYPHFRLFLLGVGILDEHVMETRVSIQRSGGHVVLRLQVPVMEVEAVYTNTHLFGMMETIENDLSLDCVPWERDWKGRKREQAHMQKLLDGSS